MSSLYIHLLLVDIEDHDMIQPALTHRTTEIHIYATIDTNIGPATAGPAGSVAAPLMMVYHSYSILTQSVLCEV